MTIAPALLPNRVELKVAIRPAHLNEAMAALAGLGLDGPPEEQRKILFFDTPKTLALFERGLILRARRSSGRGGPCDVTLKVRGTAAPEAARRFLAGAESRAKFEGDQTLGRPELASFSITEQVEEKALSRTLAGDSPLKALFGSDSRALFREHAGVSWRELYAFGPVEAKVWKVKLSDHDAKITAELWRAGSVKLLELSDKVEREDLDAFAARMARFAEKKALVLLDASKTRLALTSMDAHPVAAHESHAMGRH